MHSRMSAPFINRALRLQLELRPFCLNNNCRRLSFSNNGPSDVGVHKENDGPFNQGKWTVSQINEGGGQNLRRYEIVRREVENVCRILGSGPWGPSLEKALSSCDDKPQVDVVIGVLRRMKDVDLAINYFRWVERVTNQVNSPQTYDSLLMLMARCAMSVVHKSDYPDLMLSLFHQMQELGYEVTVHLFTTLIRVGKVDMAWKFFHEIKSHGLKPDDVSYTSMIGVLCKASKMAEVVELFEQMELNREVPCAYAYNTMIMGYGSFGRFDEAYGLLERQRMKGSIPSVIAYNSLLTCLGKKGKVDEALNIFNEMKKTLCPISLRIIFSSTCFVGGKVDAALEVQNDMKATGLVPSVMTVNIMIDRLCKANKVDEASIDGLGRHGRVDDAYRLYEQMLDSNEIPDAIVYTSLIRSFFKAGRKEDGHKVYKEMVRKSVSPDITLLNTYMDCVFKAGETEKGRALFEEIKARRELFDAMKEQGCVLDTLAYNTVIDGFCKSGKVNKAYQLLEEMKAKGSMKLICFFEEAKSIGVKLNVVVYSSLVDGFGKVGRIDEAYLIIEEMMQNDVTPNVQTWNCLLDALVKAEEVDEALVCWNSMKDLKCTPNIITYSILINGLCRVRKFNKAFVFWQEMQKQGLKPNVFTYLTMISGLAKAGNILEADKLFERFKANGGIPDSACYNTMIEGLSMANKATEAYQLFEETRLKGCNIYTKTCVILLDALHKAECLEQAAIVGAVLRETAKSQHASRSLYYSDGCMLYRCILVPLVRSVLSRSHLKLNVDAAIFPNKIQFGIGAIVRDSEGRSIACMAQVINGHFDVLNAEAIAVREGLEFVQGLNLEISYVETD
ncbi:hypothetical protein DH2020_027342 [Rehmannia glutinosa]|uniref:RNase H type-1 domain-containing protein n=1 Tax=Rehmannia glutinosa TaxID=99300 RepID=A0ABR0VYA0_REHGL